MKQIEEAKRQVSSNSATTQPTTQKNEKIEIEPQRIYGTTTNGDVQIKISGKNPEDPKTRVILPKDSVVLDREGQHVIGITPELQKRFNFKLPGGQTRRILT